MTLRWRFSIIHVAGKILFGLDELSRQEDGGQSSEPVAGAGCVLELCREEPAASVVQQALEVEDEVRQLAAAVVPDPVSWDNVREAGLTDEPTRCLLQQIRDGFPPCKKIVPEIIRQYWRHREELFESDGVDMFKERVVVPLQLRKVVL